MAELGFEHPTTHSGVRRSTTEPLPSPLQYANIEMDLRLPQRKKLWGFKHGNRMNYYFVVCTGISHAFFHGKLVH